jgi:hypothetical protein
MQVRTQKKEHSYPMIIASLRANMAGSECVKRKIMLIFILTPLEGKYT